MRGFNRNNGRSEGRDAVGVVTPRESGTYLVVAREERTYTLSLADYDDDRDDDP